MGWRRLFGMDRPEPELEPAPDPAVPAAAPRDLAFAVDRDRMFDLALTGTLHRLFAVPVADRDAAWTRAFYPAAWNASLQVADPPVFEGPDGFAYMRFHLPRPGEPFDANSLANQAGLLVERGTGAAIFPAPDATEPGFVLPMGVLDSLLRFDGWTGDPLDEVVPATVDPVFVPDGTAPGRLVATRDHRMLIGTPFPGFLPPHAARALHHHLTQGWGIADPRVALLVDPAAVPPRSLMVDRRPDDFPDPSLVEPQVRMLLWYLPPGSSIVLRPDNVTLEEMTPLADLMGGGDGQAGGG